MKCSESCLKISKFCICQSIKKCQEGSIYENFKHWVPEDLEGQQEGLFKEITLTQDHLFEEDIPLQGAFDGLVKEYTNQETAHHLLNL